MKGNRIAVILGVVVVAVLVGFLARNYWPPKSGTEGAIGAANRYTAEQISDQDVTLKDPQVQAFLQSDTFHQLATNPEFRQCAADASFKGALENKSFAEMLKTGDLGVLKAEALKTAIQEGLFAGKTPDQLQVLFGADLIRLMSNKSFVEALRTDALKTEALKTEALKTEALKTEAMKTEAMKTEAMRSQLEGLRNHAEFASFVKTDAWRALEANKLFADMLKTGDLKRIADSQKLVDLMRTEQFVKTADLANILGDQAVLSVLANDSFVKLADNKIFTEAMKVEAFNQVVKAGDLSKVVAGEQ